MLTDVNYCILSSLVLKWEILDVYCVMRHVSPEQWLGTNVDFHPMFYLKQSYEAGFGDIKWKQWSEVHGIISVNILRFFNC